MCEHCQNPHHQKLTVDEIRALQKKLGFTPTTDGSPVIIEVPTPSQKTKK